VALGSSADRVRPRSISVAWPAQYGAPGNHFPADQIKAGLRELGVPLAFEDIAQVEGQGDGRAIVLARAIVGHESDLIAFDLSDRQDLYDDVADRALVYFKLQYAPDGYGRPNVVPGGYFPANLRLYRYLPVLRGLRSLRLFRYDVYCRLGLRYGGQEERRKAHELLSVRSDFRYEGSLFRYPGGPDKLPYRTYLFEIPRAKVCVDIPGLGDFTTRLIDYLAVGACIVKPPPRSRLPITPVDGVHLVYCSSDLSDIGDVCAELVRDEETREAIARNARDFFDRNLHRRRLAARYIDAVTDARASRLRGRRGSRSLAN